MPRAKAVADQKLDEVYRYLGITNYSDLDKYLQINAIIVRLSEMNSISKIETKTTGTISERLCELALKAKVPDSYATLNKKWNWMADFSVFGQPFNLLISVKSFKAKERLLVSGSGNTLSPTVGWGLLNDSNEWTESRTRAYLYRGFVAVYLPEALLDRIAHSSIEVRNINGKPFLRNILDFANDLDNAQTERRLIDITRF